jgi:hypothetical protein
MLELRKFRVGTRRPTISGTEGQRLMPLKIFIKKHQSEDTRYAVSAILTVIMRTISVRQS